MLCFVLKFVTETNASASWQFSITPTSWWRPMVAIYSEIYLEFWGSLHTYIMSLRLSLANILMLIMLIQQVLQNIKDAACLIKRAFSPRWHIRCSITVIITAKHQSWLKMQKSEKWKCQTTSKIQKYPTSGGSLGRVLFRHNEINWCPMAKPHIFSKLC